MPWLLSFTLAFLFIIQPCPIAYSAEPYDSSEHTGYVTIIDEHGAIIMQTGLNISPGDEFINEDNRVYQILTVDNNLARARFIRDDLSLGIEPEALPAQAQVVQGIAQAPVDSPVKIAIYHTHTDESYIPTDGKSNMAGKGSIMQVGSAFAERLQQLGYSTNHSKTLHDPHDANAYHRSRRTFTKLLKEQPAALFDLHRDSAPLSVYKTTINGQDTARLLLVVGRQNQNHNTTLNYARQLKRQADKQYKGLVRGIFIARGNYNQDLNPRAILVEVGTQFNTRAAAERGITLFADVLPSLIAPNRNGAAQAGPVAGQSPDQGSGQSTAQAAGQAAAESSPPQVRSYLTDIVLTLAALVAGILAYLYLSTGSWEEVKNKLKKFRKYEFTNFFGRRKK